jgi:glycosyltransferase involved in cell wall biosynthesis
MIVKNEEAVIARCLSSAKDIADEIIIVDTGSIDDTKNIALKFTDNVYDFEWIDDFSAARNYSFSKAAKDYILWLDADDVILEEDRVKFLNLKQTLPAGIDLIMMKYNMTFDSSGKPAFSYYRERLMARRKQYRWVEPIHEVIVPEGNIIYEDIAISHKKLHETDPKRNIYIFEKMKSEGKVFSPRMKFYYARELYYQQNYDDAIQMFEDFLSSEGAWRENCIDACQNLADIYHSLNEKEKAFHSLLRSFYYGKPRSEILCAIGLHFMKNNDYSTAIFWYELASSQEAPLCSGGFYLTDYYDYIPFMQLCVCYDKVGNREKAKCYNERAAELKPDDPSVEYNRKYFAQNIFTL